MYIYIYIVFVENRFLKQYILIMANFIKGEWKNYF